MGPLARLIGEYVRNRRSEHRRPRSEDKRNAILDAAIQEFAAQGAWSTPTR